MSKSILAATVLTLCASVAIAVPVKYEFTITSLEAVGGFPDEPVADGFGYVVFDPELFIPASGEGRVDDSTNGLPTIDLSFDWLGQHYDVSTASLWAVDFYGGVPGFWAIGGRVNTCGVPWSTFSCIGEGQSDFGLTYLPSGRISTVVAITGSEGFAFGDGTWQQVPVAEVPVPEPATLGMLAAGLAGFWLFRRRQVHA
jgi:PEP-CTERM motif